MVSKDALTERLEKLRAQRDDLAAQVYRFEGAILALEELLSVAGDGAVGIVQTDEGPALDLSALVDQGDAA